MSQDISPEVVGKMVDLVREMKRQFDALPDGEGFVLPYPMNSEPFRREALPRLSMS